MLGIRLREEQKRDAPILRVAICNRDIVCDIAAPVVMEGVARKAGDVSCDRSTIVVTSCQAIVGCLERNVVAVQTKVTDSVDFRHARVAGTMALRMLETTAVLKKCSLAG